MNPVSPLMKKVLATFVIVSIVLFIITFGSFYIGKYGFHMHMDASLWWPLYHFATLSASAGLVAAVVVYYGEKKNKK